MYNARDDISKKMDLNSKAIIDLLIDATEFYTNIGSLDPEDRRSIEGRVKLNLEQIRNIPVIINEFLRLAPKVARRTFKKYSWIDVLTEGDRYDRRTKVLQRHGIVKEVMSVESDQTSLL